MDHQNEDHRRGPTGSSGRISSESPAWTSKPVGPNTAKTEKGLRPRRLVFDRCVEGSAQLLEEHVEASLPEDPA